MMALLKSLARKPIDRIAAYVAKRESHDILLQMQNDALKDTSLYVLQNLLKTTPIEDKFKLLDDALKRVTITGQYLEFGVFEGSSINHIASKHPDHTIVGFDSFEGLPQDWFAGFKKGTFALGDSPLPRVPKNVTLIKGWYNETLPSFARTHAEPVAFLHIDCDLYSSTKDIFDNLSSAICPGTVIVFDEYFNYPGWRNHEFKAFAEFISSSGLQYEYQAYCYRGEQVTIVIR